MSTAVSIHSLCARVGAFWLDIPQLEIEAGVVTGLIGKNGAGKTTLIKTILDCIRPARGEILFDGIPLYGHEEQVKARLAVVYDTPLFPASLSPKKIASMIGPFYPRFDRVRLGALLARFGIHERQSLSRMSKGTQMKFSIAMAMAQNPDILFLDEPTAGLDPAARADVLDLLLEFMQDESRTVFFSTHITSDLDKIADFIALIDNGRIVFNEVKDTLLDHYALVHVDKDSLSEDMRGQLTGLKENAFGFEGLCADRRLFEGRGGVKLARPTVEDILIYRGGLA